MPAAQREQVIVAEAIRFFAEKGFDGQIRTLAARIGITHSILFRHFSSKDALIARVYQEVYVKRVSPEWAALLGDRTRPLAARLLAFYRDYTAAIFHHDWIRIFMFAGLRGVDINAPYLALLRTTVLIPICRELRFETNRPCEDDLISNLEIERAWGLHGRIFYLAIRKFVYGMAIPPDLDQTLQDAITAFLQDTSAIAATATVPAAIVASPTKPMQRRMRPEDRERLIIGGAVTFFAQHGMDGQMRELARHLGVTHPLLYRYFPTKDALIERVYEEVYVNRWNTEWEALLHDRARPLPERLTAFYTQYSEVIDRYEWIRIFVFAGLHGNWICKRYLDLVERSVIRPVAEALRMHRCDCPAVDPREFERDLERDLEIAWGLHGQIVYLSIRRWIYDIEPLCAPATLVEAAVTAVVAAKV